MSFISVDICANRISAVQGTVTGKTIEIEACGIAPLKRNAIVDGLVKNAEEVSATLTSLLDKSHAFKARKAIVTINPGNALIREFIIPAGNPRQVTAMVRNEMLNYNATMTSDVIEYKVLENMVDARGSKIMNIRAASLSSNIVDGYHQVIQRAKLQPIAMYVYPNSIEKLLARRVSFNGISMDDSYFLILDFSYSGIMTYIIYDYMIQASRFIPIGLANFESSIISNRFDTADADDAPLEFDKVLNFRKDAAIESRTKRQAEETLVQCCNEIQKLIIYSTSRLSRKAIDFTFLVGEGSSIPGVDSFIATELNSAVVQLTDVADVKFAKKSDEVKLPYLLNAISALIRL